MPGGRSVICPSSPNLEERTHQQDRAATHKGEPPISRCDCGYHQVHGPDCEGHVSGPPAPMMGHLWAAGLGLHRVPNLKG
jgi:hypothetical protein